jgi:hypothetical protein
MDNHKTDREGSGSLKLLSWFTGLGIVGLGMMIGGACGMFELPSRAAATVAGRIVVDSVAISIAILAAAKN